MKLKTLFKSKQNQNIEGYYISLSILKRGATISKIYAKYLNKVIVANGIGYNILTDEVIMED